MKNVKFVKTALLVAVCALIFQACSKEDQRDPEDQKVFTNYPSVQEDYSTEDDMINFIDRIETARTNPDNGELVSWNYTEAEALYYLEGAFNYKYAHPHTEHDQTYRYETTLEIAANEQNYNIVELQIAYQTLYDTIKSRFDNLSAQRKFLKGLDMEITEASASMLKLHIRYYIGKFNVYLPTGVWKIVGGPLGTGGICGTQTYLNYDASDKLEQELYAINVIHQMNGFFTHTITYNDIPDHLQVHDPTYNYWPFDQTVIYSQHYGLAPYNTLAEECLPEDVLKQYINNLPILLEYYENMDLTNRIYLEYIDWTSAMVPIGSAPYHDVYYVELLCGQSHVRRHDPANDFIQ